MRHSKIKVRFSSAGTHYFDRTSGWNILLEEVVSPKETWARAPRQVSIALTNRCDLACAYCFAPKSRHELAAKTVKAWLQELDQGGAIGIGFGGGEPTLHPDFVDLCRFASETTALAVTFTTHGHHLTDELLERIQDHVHFARISVDGVGATYESIRGRSFSKICSRIQAARKYFPVGLNVVVSASSIGDLSETANIAADLGASEILLLPEQPTNHSGGLDGERKNELKEWVRNYRGPVRLAITAQEAAGFPIADPFAAESGIESYVHIDARGVLKKTSFDTAGVSIDKAGVTAALDNLRKLP